MSKILKVVMTFFVSAGGCTLGVLDCSASFCLVTFAVKNPRDGAHREELDENTFLRPERRQKSIPERNFRLGHDLQQISRTSILRLPALAQSFERVAQSVASF